MLQSLGVEGQARMIQVVYTVLWTMKINYLSYFILEIVFCEQCVWATVHILCVNIYTTPSDLVRLHC